MRPGSGLSLSRVFSVMKGNLYIISAPSGAGKTSLVKAVLETIAGLNFSVSHTTRPIRPGEVDGRDYHFVDMASFQAMIDNGELMEHAKVFDNYYGTAYASVEVQLDRGEDVILDIDWQGARQVRSVFDHTIGVFILPPSRDTLRERLRGRGQDSDTVIERRMQGAINESSHYSEYDYLIINDVFKEAVSDLGAIIRSQHLRRRAQEHRHADLLTRLLAEID